MFPIFLIGCVVGILIAGIYFTYTKTIPSNMKFKLQEEDLKDAQNDLRELAEALANAKEQIKELKAKERKPRTTKKQ